MSREGGSSDYDIFIRHSDDHGFDWSDSRRINDDTFNNGRDQFLPWLTVDNTGVISVVWLDRRHDPSQGDRPQGPRSEGAGPEAARPAQSMIP